MASEREQMIDANDAELSLRRQTAGLRKTVERLRQECGPDAANILGAALDENERLIQEFFSRSGDATDNT